MRPCCDSHHDVLRGGLVVGAMTYDDDPMSTAQVERSAGVLVAQACGEALTLALRRAARPGTSGRSEIAQHPDVDLTAWGRGINISARIAQLTSNGAVLTEQSDHAKMAQRMLPSGVPPTTTPSALPPQPSPRRAGHPRRRAEQPHPLRRWVRRALPA